MTNVHNADAAEDGESLSNVLVKLGEANSVDLVAELSDPYHIPPVVLDREAKDVPSNKYRQPHHNSMMLSGLH